LHPNFAQKPAETKRLRKKVIHNSDDSRGGILGRDKLPARGNGPSAARSVAHRKGHVMKSSTRDKIEGTAKDVKGAAKQTWGDAANDTGKRVDGTIDRVEGKIQKAAGEMKQRNGR
jgi:uncharacterized protein YjbJ (UPF0337 family)